MMNMRLALALLSVVALSTAVPQNYTSHFQSLKASTPDTTSKSTNSTSNADGAIRSTGGITRATTGASNATETARSDVISGTTTQEADNESTTDASFRTGVRTTTGSAVREDRSEDRGNATKIASGEVEEPIYGFNFSLPSFFKTILTTVPKNGSAGSNTRSSEISPNFQGNDDSDYISNSQNFNGGLTIDSTPHLTSLNSTTTTSTTTTASPFVAVSPNSSRHNVLSTSDFNNQNTFIPSDSFDAPSSSRHNFLSTSDFNNQKTPLRPEHLSRVKKSPTESKLRKNQEVIAPSSLHLSPDYYVPPFTAAEKDNINAYNNDYYLKSFPQVRTPVVYEAATSQSGKNEGYSGQFQYIIRTANLPGMLATFPASASSSAVYHSSPDTYSSQGVSSIGSQSGIGHVSLVSQPASHVSLLPNFQSSSNINFASSPQPSFGTTNSLRGSSLPGHQQTKADSASGTSRPDGSNCSTTTEKSITFHAGHQQTKIDSASGTHSPDETYHSTTTPEKSNAFRAGHQQTKAGSASGTHSPDETYNSITTKGSISSQGTNRIFSTRISDSSNNVTNSSNKITEIPLFDSSDVTTKSTVVVTPTKKLEKLDQLGTSKA